MFGALMGFHFPTPPNLPFPGAAHDWANIVIWTVAIGFFAYGIREWRATRSPLAIVMLLGGAIALFNEPVDDILGLVWHPRPHQDTVLDTFGPVPMWGLPTYIIFFGGLPYAFLRALHGLEFTLRRFWLGILITFALDLTIELPLLQTHLYTYYATGGPPLEIAGFPLYWLLINTTGPILCAAILFAAPSYFRGWRTPFILLLPIVTDAACSIAVGLPVYSALHAPHTGALVRWIGGVISCAIGLFLLDALSRWILHRTAALQAEAATAAGGASLVRAPLAAVNPRQRSGA
jgi:hypothetical protein